MDLEGKRVIITGGSGGMGSALVKVLVAAGATVASFDRLPDPGMAMVEAANAAGPGKASFHVIDLTDRDAVFAGFAEAARQMGGVDSLVHTAGVHRAAAPMDVTMDLYDLIMDANVRGTVVANQAIFEAMKASGGGSIINFGSVSGLRPEAESPIYSTSKGAVHSWTRSLAHAWGEHAIRVNAILPIIATPMYRAAKAAMTQEARLAFERDTEGGIPLGKAYGDAERDLGPVVAFLVSDASRFITGQLLPVDGGLASVR